MRSVEVAIIGAGPAGISAAVQCKRLGIIPLLMDRTGEPGGLIKNAFKIENYPGLTMPMSGPEFARLLKRNIKTLDISVEKSEAASISLRDKIYEIQCIEGSIEADTVIIATGTEHKQMDISLDEEALQGFIYHDVRTLLDEHSQPGKVLIIGSGEAACDYALTLDDMGADVYLYVRRDKLKIRGSLSNFIAEKTSLHIYYETICHAITARDKNNVSVLARSKKGSSFNNDFNAVLIAIGRFSKALNLLNDSLAMPKYEIALDESGLFIAGDARLGSLGQLGIAVGDGIMAATKAVNFLEKK